MIDLCYWPLSHSIVANDLSNAADPHAVVGLALVLSGISNIQFAFRVVHASAPYLVLACKHESSKHAGSG